MEESTISSWIVDFGVLITYMYPVAPVTRILKDVMLKAWERWRDAYRLEVPF